MSQPSPVSAKPETTAAAKKAEPQFIPKKAEPTPAAIKSRPVPTAVEEAPSVQTPKANIATPVPTETTSTAACTQIKVKTTVTPKTANDSLVATENQPLPASTAEPSITTMAPLKDTVVTTNVELPRRDAPMPVTAIDKEEAVKIEPSVTEHPKSEDSKPTAVPTPSVVVEVAGTQPELSAPESTIMEVKPDDHIKVTESTKALQQVEAQLKSREPQQEKEPAIATDKKPMAREMVKEIIDDTSSSEAQLASGQNIIITVRIKMNKICVFLGVCVKLYITCTDSVGKG